MVAMSMSGGQSFLSTPSARRATIFSQRANVRAGISIHALREEGDVEFVDWRAKAKEFLSTPSARRTTATSNGVRAASSYFYPRPPRGGRPASPFA